MLRRPPASLLSFFALLGLSLALLGAQGAVPQASAQAAVQPFGDRPAELDMQNAYRPPAVYVDGLDAAAVSSGVEGSFTVISSEDDIVSDLLYRVEVYGEVLSEHSGDPALLFAQSEVQSLPALVPGESAVVRFHTALPSLPKGDYMVHIQLLQTGGRKLGWNRAPVSYGTSALGFVHLYAQGIVLPEFENAVVEPLTGPNVDPSGVVRLLANVEHTSAAARSVTPVLTLYPFDVSRGAIAEMRFDAVSVPAQKVSTVDLPVTLPGKPGVYVGVLTLKDGERTVSTLGEYRFVVRGVSADLVSARLANGATKEGEQVFARIEWVGSADAETRTEGSLTVELRDAHGTAGAVAVPSIRLTDGVGQGTARIVLTRDLGENPSLRVVIRTKDGEVLRDASVPVTLSTQQLASPAVRSTWKLLLSWYTRSVYFLVIGGIALAAFLAVVALRFASSVRLSPRFSRTVAAMAFVALAGAFQSPFTHAFGGSNGIEVFSPITVGANAAAVSDPVAYHAYWSEIYAQPIVALFVNRPIHNSTVQCQQPVSLELRVDYAACNNIPAGGRIIARYDANGGLQTTLLGTGANWVKVYDSIYFQSPSCPGGAKACIHSTSVNTTVSIAGLPITQNQTTLQVVVKHNAYIDAAHPLPDDTISLSDIYFVRGFAQAFNIWLNVDQSACIPKPDVTIVKSAITPVVNRGSNVGYQLTVSNVGLGSAANVTVTDPVPAGFTFVPGASDPRCSLVGANVVCTLGTLNSAATTIVPLQFSTNVATACTVIPNTATVATTTSETTTANNASSTNVTVICPPPTADVEVIKTAGSGTVIRGNQTTFTVLTRNNGPDAAQNVTVIDNVPAGFTFVSSSNPSCTLQGASVVCNYGTLTSGQQISTVFTFQTGVSTACTAIPNTATVSTSTLETNAGNNSSTASVTVLCPVPQTDVQIVKTTTTLVINRGSGATFNVTVTNNGPSAANNVVVTDVIPAGLTYIGPSDPRCSSAAGVITCNLGTIAAGQSAVPALQFTFTTNASTPCSAIPNTAVVATSTQETNLGNNQSTTSINVLCPVPTTDIQVVKTAVTPVINRGSGATFSVTVTNNGPSTAQNVTLSDALPAGLTFVSVSNALCSFTTPNLSCNFGSMTSGQSVTFTVSYLSSAATACAAVPNTATVATTTQETTLANNSSTASVTVQCPTTPIADVQVVKTTTTPVINRGSGATFNVTVTNNGPNAASGVILTDVIPAGFTFIGPSDPRCTTVAGVMTCTVGTLAAGQSASPAFQFVFTTNASTACAVIPNTASVTATTQESTLANNSSTASVTVQCPVPQTDIQVLKTTSTPSVAQGGQAVFSVTVTNNGPSTAQNVTLSDALPAGLTFVSVNDARCAFASPTLSCNFGSMTSGQSITFAAVYQSSASTSCVTIPNVASVSTTTQETNIANNQSSASVSIQCPQLGCIDIVKEAYDANGTPITPIPFTFTLDGGLTVQSSTSGTARFSNVTLGSHTVTETVPSGWQQQLVTPVGGVVNVTAGPTCSTVVFKNRQTAPLTGCIEITKTTLNTQGNLLTPVAQFTFRLDGNQTTVNNSSGKAFFLNVPVGVHTVSELVPSGWTQTALTPAGGSVNVPASANNTSCAQVAVTNQQQTVSQSADLSIAKSGPSTVLRGNTLTYQLTVQNIGSVAATGVQVTDTIPPELNYLPGSSDSRCSQQGSAIICQLGTLNAGQQSSIALAFQAQGSPSSSCTQRSIQNSAFVTSSTADANQSNNTSQTVTTQLTCNGSVDRCPDVSVRIIPDVTRAETGDEVTFRIELENEDNDDITVDVEAEFDTDFSFLDASDGGDDSSRRVRWDDIDIDEDDTETLRLDLRVRSGARDGDRLEVKVEVGGSDCEDDEADIIIGTPSTPVTPQPARLTIDKSVDRTTAQPGDVVTYTVTVRNAGTAAVSGINLEDVYSAGELAVLDASFATVSGNAMRWSIDRLDGNTTRTFRYSVRLGRALRHGDIVSNTVKLAAQSFNLSDSATVRIIQQLPQTGLGRFFTGSNTATLTPVTRTATDGSSASVGIIALLSVITAGVATGGLFARRFF